ncbi:MAG: hypothetical protein Q8R98_15040, partial [Rubrivivax sp.]|nr:hypothetical protein [Rubrivivax sp.]
GSEPVDSDLACRAPVELDLLIGLTCLRELPGLPELAAELVSQAEELEREADAIDTARIDAGIAAVTEVVNYKPSSWRTLRDWGIQRNELTAKEDQLLLFAATAGKVPSERQAAAILQIRRRLEAEGFRPA